MRTYLSHPKIVPDTVEERKYQIAMAEGCLKRDTLIILPTGLGKTVVALMVAAEVLAKGRKVLITAPTKPLVDQHCMTFGRWLKDVDISAINGNMAPERRCRIVEDSDMVISTPQAIANDLENGRYDLSKFGLVIYDEAHRGVGNYAFVKIAEYNTGISMGMTASPGSEYKKIVEICHNLSFVHIDMRTDMDPDVSPYVFDTFIKRMYVNLPKDITDISRRLRMLVDEYANDLARMGLMSANRPITTSYLLQIGSMLQSRLRNRERSNYVYRGLVVQSICVKLLHAVGLVETQGVTPLRKYLNKLLDEAAGEKPSKSSAEIVNREEFRSIVRSVRDTKVEHPKISRIMSLVSQRLDSGPDSRIMIFAQYRDTCELLVEKLSCIHGVNVEKLIGQSKGGLKQKEQIQLLERFRNGECNTLVSTSVGEEGLDISGTDMVIFYEPVPSEIRTIQRRGRTGRKNDGDVAVLIAANTMDEAFEKSSAEKEEKMRERLDKLNHELAKTITGPARKGQTYLDSFSFDG